MTWFPDKESNPGTLHWERGVLATGLPGKSLTFVFASIVFLRQSKFFLHLRTLPSSTHYLILHFYITNTSAQHSGARIYISFLGFP